MQDMKAVRANRTKYIEALKNKGIDLDLDLVIELDDKRIKYQSKLEELRRVKNELSKQIANALENKEQLMKGARDNARKLNELEKTNKECVDKLNYLKLKVPGLPAKEVPVGQTDKDNVELYKVGEKVHKNGDLLDHLEILKKHNMIEQVGAAKIAGARAYALKNYGALLENAVLKLAYDHIQTKGYTPVQPPIMVRHNAMQGTGYFPFGEDNAYFLEKDKLYLTGTAEVGMLAMNMDKCFKPEELPVAMFGITTCFRREAGAYGRDTKGLYRVHQFQKVEQVIITRADNEEAQIEHDKLLENAKEILEALELPYRVVECCTGELGLGQVRKYDIETWMPGRNAYGETHSCSNFQDFQARRLNIKYLDQNGKKQIAYTLNNTAIATPRILIPLLENHQLKNGNIYVPKKLRPYLNGIAEIKV